VFVAVAALSVAPAAQETPPASQTLARAVSSSTPGAAAELRFNNRPITVFRATILGRPPADRASGAVRVLDSLVESGSVGPVTTRFADGAIYMSIGTSSAAKRWRPRAPKPRHGCNRHSTKPSNSEPPGGC
jgi:hypothetical protein